MAGIVRYERRDLGKENNPRIIEGVERVEFFDSAFAITFEKEGKEGQLWIPTANVLSLEFVLPPGASFRGSPQEPTPPR